MLDLMLSFIFMFRPSFLILTSYFCMRKPSRVKFTDMLRTINVAECLLPVNCTKI